MRNRTAAAFIVAVALALRLWGIGFDTPHADEPIVVNHALAYASGDLHPRFFAIPPLLSYLAFAFYGAWYALGHLAGVFPDTAAFEALFFRAPLQFYVPGRVAFGALPGAATVALLVLVMRHRFGERAALLSALFLAVDFLHARDSHYLYTDALMTLAGLVVCLESLRVAERGSPSDSLRAGLWVGAAAAVKYNAALSAAAVAAAHALFRRPFARLALAGAVSVIAFFALNPFAALDPRGFATALGHQAGAELPAGIWHHARYSLPGASGAGALLLAAAGTALAFRRNARQAAVFFAYPAVYTVSLAIFSQHHERYVLPLGPFVAAAAGIGSWAWLERARGGPARIVALLAIAASLAFPAAKILRADLLFTRSDTTREARRWIETNLQPGERIAFSHSFYRPALQRAASQRQALERASAAQDPRAALKNRLAARHADPSRPSYELFFLWDGPEVQFSSVRPLLPFAPQALREAGVRYVVVNYGVTPEHEEFLAWLRGASDRIARFSPYRDPSKDRSIDRFSLTCAAYSWRELFARERFGPVLEIYRLR